LPQGRSKTAVFGQKTQATVLIAIISLHPKTLQNGIR
jgi:hypothetical protein